MNSLPTFPFLDKRLIVKSLFVRMILVLALAAGTLHASETAHADPVSDHADHGCAAALDAAVDHHGESDSPDDGKSDSVHHHHYPSAMGARGCAFDDTLAAGKSLLHAHPQSSLTSFSQAPPTEPPSA